MSVGMRVMWLVIAPAMTIGIALALPLVTILFRRGQFSTTDSVAVSGLIQIYLLALPPACLAAITGRGFYALKDTRTIAILGSIESVAYIFYTAVLSRTFGVTGVAAAYVIFFNLSLIWQVLILRHKAGKVGGGTVIHSFVRTGLGALLGGAMAWGATTVTPNIMLQLALGVSCGLAVYGLILAATQRSEIRQIWSLMRA
jgi:putative peptidoglycan lipid II flippase